MNTPPPANMRSPHACSACGKWVELADAEGHECWEIEIEQDGPRYRWVLLFGDRRMAKGGQWWDTEEEADAAASEFLDALRQILGGEE